MIQISAVCGWAQIIEIVKWLGREEERGILELLHLHRRWRLSKSCSDMSVVCLITGWGGWRNPFTWGTEREEDHEAAAENQERNTTNEKGQFAVMWRCVNFLPPCVSSGGCCLNLFFIFSFLKIQARVLALTPDKNISITDLGFRIYLKKWISSLPLYMTKMFPYQLIDVGFRIIFFKSDLFFPSSVQSSIESRCRVCVIWMNSGMSGVFVRSVYMFAASMSLQAYIQLVRYKVLPQNLWRSCWLVCYIVL